MSARLFIRNDDVWTLDRPFRSFFDMAMDHGLPVVHAVIPGKMDKGIVKFLCRAKEKKPRSLDIVQHGWMHTDHSLVPGTKYEFGVSRPLKSQRDDIEQGLKMMRKAFGEHFIPAFVPPYHGYDERTLQALDEQDFKVFSAGSRRMKVKAPMIELPARISFSCYDKDGAASINPAVEIFEMLVKGLRQQPLSGVLTHHADFKTAASRKELARFFGLVAALRDKQGCRTLLFSDLGRE